jgi:hypothetical protein
MLFIGSLIFGSYKSMQIDINSVLIVKEGDQLSFKISTQTTPFLSILGWKIGLINLKCFGGEYG